MRSIFSLIAFALFFTFLVSDCPAQLRMFSRDLRAELRPFDFTDKYYSANGVDSRFVRSRRDGTDGMSVFDYSEVPYYRNVRVTATWPAYAPDGSVLFWNLFAEFDKDAVIIGPEGYRALDVAQAFPMFVFPSNELPDSDRQSPMIRINDGYFEKNPLGVAVVYSVVFTELANTDKGQAIMKLLETRNGLSVDGTPIIRTAAELDELRDLGVVDIRVRQNGTPFIVGKVMRYANVGGITPDSYLVTVKRKDGSPLPSESIFIKKFECLKDAKGCQS